MKTSDFLYDLPEELIAQTPIDPRDHSRLLVYDRRDRSVSHRHFYDLPEYLKPGDCLVINDTRVIPARLYGVRSGGGACEILLLKQLGVKKWEALVRPGAKLKPGKTVSIGDGRLTAHVLDEAPGGARVIDFECEGTMEAALDELGEMPLPPYIKAKLTDKTRYQTVYAKYDGSAAAPTAGLHFTKELLDKIKAQGIDIVPVLLHVGLGTFRPVKAENIEEHEMHSEYFEVSPEAAKRINEVKHRGGRVIAVGTTSVRTLESASPEGTLLPLSGDTSIFIKPGYEFKCVDALITNFHLPGSTLLMLVSALMGREEALRVYETAVLENYRFFSFGDAMLIL
ncbi:MAG: tRNA preQ1(34) S-adenosylmethionine ribosyltransferase-isomerase QueA [Clostridia bacterium]|nr:tRNA preQ1(34) S-adenosylmethionine ribosyltransferase-isomerase QueA [Clostridia bacterium]